MARPCRRATIAASETAQTQTIAIEVGLVRVVRTRRVRAIEERYFGRTARMFYVGMGKGPGEEALPRS